ncbi:MAG: histidine phosphatase family protein [Colwellia sp.]|nr:histidine phosphatase family protein [Colwellia sp.]MCW8864437.1 histidine phosphatase family protein [Colwellia sp.]MCW9080850.1 histidine phosphatase family protein [Colwellia sp.]
MTTIYLIRHGQASFAEQDYDKLSTKGIAQAKMLGEYWQTLARHKADSSDLVQYYSGSLLRHEQTAEHFFNGLLGQESKRALTQSASLTRPKGGVITHAGFNELDHVDILTRYNENWRSFQAMRDSVIQQDQQSSLTNSHGKNQINRLVQQEFFQAMKRWVTGDYDDYQESWLQFQQRCITSLHEVVMQVSNKSASGKLSGKNELMIFTSGGVIGVIVGHILQLGAQESLQLSQQLVNSGVSKIIATKDGCRLNYLNNYSHLELSGQEWLSYF